MDINVAKREFLEHIEVGLGRSLKTVENYERYLNYFFKEAGIKKVKDITDDKVHKFRIKLNRQKGREETMKKSTQNYYLIALRMFLKYLKTKDIDCLSPDRISLAKTPSRQIDVITTEELKRIFDSIDIKSSNGLRDNAIMNVLFTTGLRVSELISLQRNIDLKNTEITIRGKGDKVRVVFLKPETTKAIKDYLNSREDTSDALFVGKNKTRITARSVERIVEKYATAAGVSKKVTPHVLRHMFATILLQNGADIRSVQEMLGHSNIATTQVYTHITNKKLKETHEQFHKL